MDKLPEYKYGKRSKRVLKTLHPDLQIIMVEALRWYDIALTEGHRDKKTQNDYFDRGLSKLRYPESNHNYSPSLAVDALPYPPNWNNINRFSNLMFFIKGIAAAKGIKIRLGIDWNDNMYRDEKFLDAMHIELVGKVDKDGNIEHYEDACI